MIKNSVRSIAKTLALLWAAFWVFFVVASALAEPTGPGSKAFVCLLGIGFFLISAMVACRWDRIGGVLLTVEGVGLCIANFTFLHNPPATQMLLLLTLGLPPLLAGIMLLTPRLHPQTG